MLVFRDEIQVVVDDDDNSWITAGLCLDYITSAVMISTVEAGLNCV